MIRLILFFTLPFLFISCNNTLSSKDNKINIAKSASTIYPTDTIAYTYQSFRKNSDYYLSNDGKIDTTYYHISYPVFDSLALNDSIKNLLLFDGENTILEASQSFLDGYEEYVGDVDSENSNSWSKEIKSTVIENSPKLITLFTDIYEYSGGAHGLSYTFFTNFDLQKNKTLIWEDIIEFGKFDDLNKIAEKHFRKLHHLSDDASLDKDFFFHDGIFTLNDNFGLTKSALVIFYNEYEIKPYSEGSTILEIPYKDLNTVFNDRAKELIKSIN